MSIVSTFLTSNQTRWVSSRWRRRNAVLWSQGSIPRLQLVVWTRLGDTDCAKDRVAKQWRSRNRTRNIDCRRRGSMNIWRKFWSSRTKRTAKSRRRACGSEFSKVLVRDVRLLINRTRIEVRGACRISDGVLVVVWCMMRRIRNVVFLKLGEIFRGKGGRKEV